MHDIAVQLLRSPDSFSRHPGPARDDFLGPVQRERIGSWQTLFNSAIHTPALAPVNSVTNVVWAVSSTMALF